MRHCDWALAQLQKGPVRKTHYTMLSANATAFLSRTATSPVLGEEWAQQGVRYLRCAGKGGQISLAFKWSR
jgi:hypothetical protein